MVPIQLSVHYFTEHRTSVIQHSPNQANLVQSLSIVHAKTVMYTKQPLRLFWADPIYIWHHQSPPNPSP